jgi:hypothetical protein
LKLNEPRKLIWKLDDVLGCQYLENLNSSRFSFIGY